MKADNSTPPNTDWSPSYWQKDNHGSAWEKVKAAMQRDWEQTKSDFKAGGKDLGQDVGDTVKQATGKDPIPPEGVANPDTDKKADWAEAEAGVRYGYGAHQQYGADAKWNDALEVKLSNEWEANKAGKPFVAVRRFVRHGWNAKS